MNLDSLQHMAKFRSHCLCGYELKTHIKFDAADSEYITITPYRSQYENIIDIPTKIKCNLDSQVSPYGQVDFEIIIMPQSSRFHLGTNSAQDEVFVRKHFSIAAQLSLKIQAIRVCYGNPYCDIKYKLSTYNLVFDLDTSTIGGLSLFNEHFFIKENGKSYSFVTNFENKTTVIGYEKPQPRFILPATKFIEMNSDKFLRYPFERDFLLEKIHTLLLFS